MLYMFFQSGREPILIQRIVIGLEAILKRYIIDRSRRVGPRFEIITYPTNKEYARCYTVVDDIFYKQHNTVISEQWYGGTNNNRYPVTFHYAIGDAKLVSPVHVKYHQLTSKAALLETPPPLFYPWMLKCCIKLLLDK